MSLVVAKVGERIEVQIPIAILSCFFICSVFAKSVEILYFFLRFGLFCFFFHTMMILIGLVARTVIYFVSILDL